MQKIQIFRTWIRFQENYNGSNQQQIKIIQNSTFVVSKLESIKDSACDQNHNGNNDRSE